MAGTLLFPSSIRPCFSTAAAHFHGRHSPPPPKGLATISRLRTAAEPTQKLESLWTWLTTKGIVPKSAPLVLPEVVPEGLGLVAQRSISPGEEVVSVPSDVWITASTAKASQIGHCFEGRRPWVLIAAFLLYEKNQPNSAWRPYLELLPERSDSPLFWSNEELAELQGTQLLGSTLGYKQYVESEYQKLQEVILSKPQLFDPYVFTQEAFLWAFGILRSRSFPPLTGDDLALVPLADLINHGLTSPAEESSWERKSSGFFSRNETLVVRAPAAFKVGEQVVMQYGRKKSNGQLALDYGFVEDSKNGNNVRDSFTLTLEIPESDRFFGDKLDIAELNGLNTTVYFDLTRCQDLPENMLAFLRLVALNGSDAFLLEALFRNSVWEHLQLPVSRENEEAVCQAVVDGCCSTLASYCTTIAEDLVLLRSDQLSPRLEIAVVARLGEKRVLEELQLQFEAQMAKLDRLEYYAERRLRTLGLLDDTGSVTPWIFND